jgi:preprotein translocase subunit SecE
MNREMKRLMQRQGQVDADGAPAAARVQERPRPTPRPPGQRISAGEFVGEVRDELRKVNWPTRAETRNYSTVVLATLVALTAMIFALNFVLQKGVSFLIK